MSRFLLTREAEIDLLEIESYITQHDGPRPARRVMEQLLDGIIKVAEMPGMGHRHADIPDPDVRVWIVHSWLILYDPQSRPVLIWRVIDGRRDIAGLS